MAIEPQTVSAPAAARVGIFWEYLELTKPNVVWLILMSTMVGFYVASPDAFSATLLLHTVAATALLAAGTGSLNQWWERDLDRKMRRTESRPCLVGNGSAEGRFADYPPISGSDTPRTCTAIRPSAPTTSR